ncbi:hypothetical protein ACT3CD_00570 [Geofilum sp. OHC36d9]|uniref:hypothetical protein n=1 Tax=Geofilum sp. OHC36d9 TaxID=3458413 RepID=UPI0040333478
MILIYSPAMVQILLKETILSLILLLAGFLIGQVTNWVVFTEYFICLSLLCVVFICSTLLFNRQKKHKKQWFGLTFATMAMLAQLIILLFLFLFLEPQNKNHRIAAISLMVSYFIFFITDTHWKVKWLFY